MSLLLRQGVASREMQPGAACRQCCFRAVPLGGQQCQHQEHFSSHPSAPAPCLLTCPVPHTKGLEMIPGICVGGQAAARNTCLLFLCRQKECVGNTTNEHLSCGVISSCYLKTALQMHRRQKLSSNSTQSKGRRGSGTSLEPLLVTGRWAGSNTALAGPHSTMGSMPRVHHIPSETQEGESAQVVHCPWQKAAKRFLPEPGIVPDSTGKGSQQQSNPERGFSGQAWS